MTVSTSGIVPAIRDYAKERVRPKLAVSLNASNSETRREVMPVTKKWDIPELMAALKEIPLRTREAVTFEYVLLGGVNDQPVHARELLAMLREYRLRAKINLIAWNPGPGIAYTQPRPEDVETFQRMLIDAGVRTYVRRPRGRDIYAACGQLKRTVEQDPLVSIQ
jgi:23S rRNA (adenine2503-C2)-methyltransferase